MDIEELKSLVNELSVETVRILAENITLKAENSNLKKLIKRATDGRN